MAKKSKAPSAAEVRAYREQKKAEMEDCIRNHKTFVIHGPTFPGEDIWSSEITLPLLEAAEQAGCSNEEIWELCKKLSQTSHAPVTLKDYERMLPFAERPATVDAVLKLLESYIPPFSEKYWIGKFDIKGYYYCLALLSLSEHRKDECETQLWSTVDQFIEHRLIDTPLLRNMRVLGDRRPALTPMREKLEACLSKQ